MVDQEIKKSIDLSKEIRRLTLGMIYKAKASHIGGALSMADILSVLYGRILKYDPKNPSWDDRDRFLLSKGHACSSLYATLALSGFFPLSLLDEYGTDGTYLLSHTSDKIPGIELSTGSLGHALPVACGISLAGKRKGKNYKTYVIISDGELDEGSNWESILFAPQHHLDNLVLIVDYNKIQSLGTTKEVINLESLSKKFEAFNWETLEIDGHDHNILINTFKNLVFDNKLPKVIIANTVKGKGIDFMENRLLWHYKSPTEQEFKDGLCQILGD